MARADSNKVRDNKTKVKVNAARDKDRKVTWDLKVAGIKTQVLPSRVDKAVRVAKVVSKAVADKKDKAAWEVKGAASKADPAAALVVAVEWVPDKEGTIYKCVD